MGELKIAICEDCPVDADRLCRLVKKYAFAEDCPVSVATFGTGEALVNDLDINDYSIVFLDIHMPGYNGLDTGKLLRLRDTRCQIVFCTQSREDAVEAFSLDAAHYLVKPATTEDVWEAMDRCRRHIKSDRKTISILSNRRPVTLPVGDILYVEVDNKTSYIHTLTEVLPCRASIGDLESCLPSPPFLRCHRSYIVNMAHVKNLSTDFVLTNGEQVYVRQSYLTQTRKKYLQYMMDSAESSTMGGFSG